MRLLTCKNLDIGYHDGLVARDINFHIDEGDYLFTTANGAHEAVNNFLAAQGFDTADGMDAEAGVTTVATYRA